MKYIGPEIGRYVLLFPWEEVRPIHGTGILQTITEIKDRYRFNSSPNMNRPWKEIENSIHEFRDGAFLSDGQNIAIYGLDIYSDGFGVHCRITDDAAKVAEDLIAWSKEHLGFRPFTRVPKKIYVSSLVIEFETPVTGLFGKWEKFQKLFSDGVKKHHDLKDEISAYRLSWKCDPSTVLNANLISEFIIERKANELYSANRFLCTAPLPTSEAIEVWKQVEELAK